MHKRNYNCAVFMIITIIYNLKHTILKNLYIKPYENISTVKEGC